VVRTRESEVHVRLFCSQEEKKGLKEKERERERERETEKKREASSSLRKSTHLTTIMSLKPLCDLYPLTLDPERSAFSV